MPSALSDEAGDNPSRRAMGPAHHQPATEVLEFSWTGTGTQFQPTQLIHPHTSNQPKTLAWVAREVRLRLRKGQPTLCKLLVRMFALGRSGRPYWSSPLCSCWSACLIPAAKGAAGVCKLQVRTSNRRTRPVKHSCQYTHTRRTWGNTCQGSCRSSAKTIRPVKHTHIAHMLA